ncbi:MAG: response regulator transcription factor [Bryobacteraceae bacterium]
MRLRMILADDHDLIVEAFRTMLEPEYDVVGTAADGHQLVSAALELKPDIVIADISMPRMNGLAATAIIRKQLPSAKLILLTMSQDPDYAATAFRLGVHGYLLKNSAGSELAECLKTVCSGVRYLTPKLANGNIADLLLEQPNEIADVTALTTREREVLQLLAEGNSKKEAATTLEITPRTVAFHKYRIMEQFHLKSTAELVQFAIRNKIIS